MNTRALMSGLCSGVLLLAACGGTSGQPASAGGGEAARLTIAAKDNNESLDPAAAFVGWVSNRNGVSETLIDVDEQLRLVPGLATAWKNRDTSTWEITLREGVAFHNGAPMDAAAVKASLEHSMKTNVRAKSQLPLTAIEAKGNALTIRTAKPLAALPHILTDPMMSIQALGAGIDPAKKPVATGPFKVTEYVPQQRLELDAHETYWAGKPKLGHVTVKSYADAQAMGLALQSGEADIVVRPDAAGMKAFSDTGRYTVWPTISTRSDGVIINTTSPVMKDPRARKAINHALDRDAYVSLLHGMAKSTHAFFPENVSFGGEKGLRIDATGKDLAKARQLFLQQGYTESAGALVKDSKPLTLRVLTYPGRPYLGQLAQLLQSDLRGIGVTVRITELTSTTDAMKAGDFDLGMYSMATAPTGDPEYFFDTMLRSGADSNYSHYSSPAFDAKLDEMSRAFTPQERETKARAAEQQLLDDLPYIMLGSQQWWAVSNAKVRDLEIRPTEYHLLGHTTHVD